MEQIVINRKHFFDSIRESLFNGKINSDQVKCMDSFIESYENCYEEKDMPLNAFAYLLATVYHETSKTFLPIEEYGKGKGKKYGIANPKTGKVYYGRGYVQLTWDYNYEKMGKMISVDLLNHPEEAMNHLHAMCILFNGMFYGMFTGKKLSDYFTTTTSDWINARRIINGTDKASLISEIAKKFHKALTIS